MRLIKILLFFIPLTIASGINKPVITADKPISFDAKDKSLLAEGNAELEYQNFLLQAEKIKFFKEEQEGFAENDVVLTTNKLRLVANKISYAVQTEELGSGNFKMSFSNGNVSGKKISGDLNKIIVENLTYFTKEPGTFALNIKAKKAVIKKNESIEFYNAQFKIGAVTVLYTPYYKHSLKRSLVNWKAEFGVVKRDKNLGRYYRNDIMFRIGQPYSLGLLFDYYRKRGILVGPQVEYSFSNHTGKFKSGFISDKDVQGRVDSSGKPLEKRRYFLDFKHKGHLNDRIDFVAQLNVQKDPNVIKDFRPDDYDVANQHPDSFAEVAYRGDDTIISATSRFRPNKFQAIKERRPDIRIERLANRFKNTPFYTQWGLGFAKLKDSQINEELNEETNRLDAYYKISVPLKTNGIGTFTPLATTRVNHYFNSSRDRDDCTRVLFQPGFDYRITAFAEYDLENEYWGWDGLRHIISPVVQYRYIANTKSGRDNIPPIEQNLFTKDCLEEIDLMHKRDLDRMDGMNLVRLGIENYFYTDINKSVCPKKFLSFDLYQDFLFKKDNDRKALSDTFARLYWTPSDFLGFSTTGRFDPNEKKLKEFNTALSLRENEIWQLSLGHRYLYNKNNQASMGVIYKFNSRVHLNASLNVDAHKGNLISQTYTLHTILDNNWKIDWQLKWKKLTDADRTNGKDAWELKFTVEII